MKRSDEDETLNEPCQTRVGEISMNLILSTYLDTYVYRKGAFFFNLLEFRPHP